MARASYGPATLRAWRAQDKRRTAKAVGAAIGRTGTTIANYEAGACPCERDRVLLSILCADPGMRPESAWRTSKEMDRDAGEMTRAIGAAMQARVEMGG